MSVTAIEPARFVRNGINRQHVVLSGVSWETYRRLREECDHLKMTYDRGILEIMSPSPAHEKIGKFIARLVETLTLELRIPLIGFGRTTWNSEHLLRGLQADECYYIQHVNQVTGKEVFDLTTDPPPDLAVEVDIASSSLDKEDIYRQLGVPELWRYEAGKLHIRILRNGNYVDHPSSVCLPMLPIDRLESIVERRNQGNDTQLIGEFQDWVRSTIGTRK